MGDLTPPPAWVGRKSYEAGFKSFEPQAIVVDYRRGPRRLGKSLYLSPLMLRPLVRMAVFRPGLFQGGFAPMSLRALLYRRPSEPSVVQVVFDRAIYLVRLRRHRQARRYTLHRRRLARGGSHHAAARQCEGGQGVRTEARRLDRARGSSACPRRRRSRTAWRCRCAASRTASCIGAASVGRCGSKPTPSAPGSCAWPASRRTSTAASTIFSSARRNAISRPRPGATRASSASPSSASACATSRAAGARAPTPACCLLLAAHSRPAVRARLSRRARGLPSRRAQPLAAVLAIGETPLSECGARQGVARRQRHRPAPLRSGGAAPGGRHLSRQSAASLRARHRAIIPHRA